MRYRIGRMTTLAVLALAAASHAAEPTSQACARWEDNYLDLVLQASALLASFAFALAWLLPLLMSATGKAWRFALGLFGRCFWPAFVLSCLALVGFATFVLPGPMRSQLAAIQIEGPYFPAQPEPGKTTRPPTCTNVNFSKRGLAFGVGAGETLAAQPLLVLCTLLGSTAAGALLARLAYWLVGRFRSPFARGRRAAAEARALVN